MKSGTFSLATAVRILVTVHMPKLTNYFLLLTVNFSISNTPWDCHLWQCAQRVRIQPEVLWSSLSKLSLPVALDGDASRTPAVKSVLWVRLLFPCGFWELSLNWLPRYTEMLLIVCVGLNLPKTLPAGACPFDFLCNPVWNQILLQPQLVCLTSKSSKKFPSKQWLSALTQIQNTFLNCFRLSLEDIVDLFVTVMIPECAVLL